MDISPSTSMTLFFQKLYDWNIDRIEYPFPTEGSWRAIIISVLFVCVCDPVYGVLGILFFYQWVPYNCWF